MITSIRLQDFKGHRDTTVPLGRFTVLVGPNGAGKTSVLEALWLQSQLVERPPDQVLAGDWSVDDLYRHGASDPITLTLVGNRPTGDWQAKIEIKSGHNPTLIFDGVTYVLASGRTLSAAEFTATLNHAAFYKLNAQYVAAAAYSDWPGPRVERDGTNTAVALAALKLGYDEAFGRIEEEMRRIVPNVERVRIRQANVQRPLPRGDWVIGSKIFFDFRGAPGVPAHMASEGTLITLALLTVLHSPYRPSLLLLDDFDQSLHPQAQMELVRLIKRLLTEFDDLQIVATTHSPYVLDQLDPSEIHAFALRDDGTVASKRLSDHPEAQRMRGALTTGQLWSLDPEPKWVLQDKAS